MFFIIEIMKLYLSHLKVIQSVLSDLCAGLLFTIMTLKSLINLLFYLLSKQRNGEFYLGENGNAFTTLRAILAINKARDVI